MEKNDCNYPVLERCVGDNLEIGTEEYNLINGPVDLFRSFVTNICENEKERISYLDDDRKKALENFYSLTHNENLSPEARVNICKFVKEIIDSTTVTGTNTMKYNNWRWLIAAGTFLGTLITYTIDRENGRKHNEPWYVKIFK